MDWAQAIGCSRHGVFIVGLRSLVVSHLIASSNQFRQLRNDKYATYQHREKQGMDLLFLEF